MYKRKNKWPTHRWEWRWVYSVTMTYSCVCYGSPIVVFSLWQHLGMGRGAYTKTWDNCALFSVQLVQIRPCDCCKYVANGDGLQSPGMLLASLSHCVASGNIATSTSQGSHLNQEGKVSPTLGWLCTIASPGALSHWKS